MIEPKASHPYWPDALDEPSDAASLKPWSWALERLQNSHNYWIATSRVEGRPHLMLVWGVWWQDAFWFSTGSRTREDVGDHRVLLGGVLKRNADEPVIL